jgi:hypothetical protein
MAAILPKKFDGSLSEVLVETQPNCQFLAKMSSPSLFEVAASLAGSIQRRCYSTITSNIFFGQMAAILPQQFDGSCTLRNNVRNSTKSSILSEDVVT